VGVVVAEVEHDQREVVRRGVLVGDAVAVGNKQDRPVALVAFEPPPGLGDGPGFGQPLPGGGTSVGTEPSILIAAITLPDANTMGIVVPITDSEVAYTGKKLKPLVNKMSHRIGVS
jgi:hypothetical protein